MYIDRYACKEQEKLRINSNLIWPARDETIGEKTPSQPVCGIFLHFS